MDLFNAIKGRRSIRSFRKNNVSPVDLNKILESATLAPSAGNIQPWEFIIVRKTKTKRDLSQAALNQAFIQEAPVVIVICANQTRSRGGYGKRGVNLYCLQDTAAAIQNLLLAAYALGLSTCWVGAFDEIKVQKILSIPEDIRPIAIVPLGYSAEVPSVRSRRFLKDIVHYEKYLRNWE
jgi:nitroreductase